MSAAGSDNGKNAAGEIPPEKNPARRGFFARLLRKLGRALVVIAVIAAIVLPAGFLWFVTRLPADEIVLDRNADGIVVLTGGWSRDRRR